MDELEPQDSGLRSTAAPRWAASLPLPRVDAPAAPAQALPAWQQLLTLVERHLPFTRRAVMAGRRLQVAGEPFTQLHVLRTGVAKIVTLAPDGREQFVGVQFKGDWIGLDAIASGCCVSSAVALDTSDLWSLHYDSLLRACAQLPALLHNLHRVMSTQLARERASRLALATLSAEARLADFVSCWAGSLHERGLRSDSILLTLPRTDIASCLGLSPESVSRAFTRLQRRALLRIEGHTRREVMIPDLEALAAFVSRSLDEVGDSGVVLSARDA